MRPSLGKLTIVVMVLSTLCAHAFDGDETATPESPGAVIRPEPHIRPGETPRSLAGSCGDNETMINRIVAEQGKAETDLQRQLPRPSGLEVRNRVDGIVNSCMAKLRKYVQACDNPSLRNGMDCARARNMPADVPSNTSIPGAYDLLITATVSEANCYRLMGNCFRNGSGLEGFPPREALNHECGGKATIRITELGPSGNDNIYERMRLTAFRDFYAKTLETHFKPRAACEDNKGKDSEGRARQLLSQSNGGRDKPTEFTISCLDRFRSFRGCHYTANGERKLTEMEDMNMMTPVLRGDAPVRMENGCSGQCLRSESSRGCMEVLTAGHCTNNLNGRPAEILVYDRENRAHWVTASECSSNFNGELRGDYSICRLDRSVDTNPMYVAAFDSTVTGPNCIDDGHNMRCGPGFYEKLANERARVSATIFPANGLMSYTTGQLYYDRTNHTLYHDLMTGRGASGAGLVVQVGNRLVVVGAHSWGQPVQMQGGGAVIDYNQWQQLQVWRVSSVKLQDATPFFAQLANPSIRTASLTGVREPANK